MAQPQTAATTNPNQNQNATTKRMTMKAIAKGVVRAPLRVLLYGVPGCGKTTFAADAPAPIFLGVEDGAAHMDTARLPTPETWSDVLDAVHLLTHETHDYKTLVIDTLDSIEPLCWEEVCRKDTKHHPTHIEDAAGGFKNGYTLAVDEWRQLIARLEAMRAKKGMNFILLSHSVVKNFKNPEGPDYERFIPKLHEKGAATFMENVDCTLFARFESVVREDRKTKRMKGISTGVRVMETVRTAAYDAKNRFNLPESMTLSWADFSAAVDAFYDKGPASAELKAALELQIGKLGDVDKKRATDALGRAGSDAVKLAQLDNWVADRLAPAPATSEGK